MSEQQGCPLGEVSADDYEHGTSETWLRGYNDGVEQERASIAKEIGRLNDRERLLWAQGYVRAYHLTRERGRVKTCCAACARKLRT